MANDPQNIVVALKHLGPSWFEQPSSLEWVEMKVNMDATLAMGLNIGAQTSLSAEFSILVLQGKSLLQVQNEMQAKVSKLSPAQSGFPVTGTGQYQLLALAVIPSTNSFIDGDLQPPDVDNICNDRQFQITAN